MTDAQTEARAIAERLSIHHSDADRIAIIATALAAKAAELAELSRLLENEKFIGASGATEWMQRAERAEAQLAEANKALDEIVERDQHTVYPENQPGRRIDGPLARIARRAREQGGE